MEYTFHFADFQKGIRTLQNIARREGSPSSLDTENEKKAARTLVLETLAAFEAAKPTWGERVLAFVKNPLSTGNIKIFDEAKKQLEDFQKQLQTKSPLFIHPLFRDTFFKDFRIASELDTPSSYLFTVYHGGGGHLSLSEKVFVSAKEWTNITEPFLEKAGSPSEERTAIGSAVSRFEKIVGPKAGTQKDIGGLEGNKPLTVINTLEFITMRRRIGEIRIPSVEEREGQQDCINELKTTRQLLRLLDAGGFLQSHKVPNGYVVTDTDFGYPHYAPYILENDSETRWVVDSWVGGNGATPDVMDENSWRKKYKR